MSRPRFQPIVDRAWADALGITVEELHAPGIRVVPALPGDPRAYVLRLGDATVVAAPRAFGPSWHGYLHRDDFVPGPAVGRRVVDADRDGGAIERFRHAVGDEDFHESGFGGESFPAVAWLVEDAEGVAALGNMTDFAGTPADVGLVTRPDARGRGLATRLATAMLLDCFRTVEVARYRALTTNAASLAVAARLGFEGYGENVVVRSL